jgi:hypothetical protein
LTVQASHLERVQVHHLQEVEALRLEGVQGSHLEESKLLIVAKLRNDLGEE